MKKLSFVMITLFLSIFFLFSNNVDAARLNCGLFRGGTDTATNMIASPNPPESVADTNAACITYCDQSGGTNGDKCIRGTTVIKTYSSVTPGITSSGETLGTYIGYMNGNVFITTKNITRESAYDNCKLNATNNPNASVKCTWNGEEIFTNEQKGILEMYVNNNLKIRDIAITKDYSYTNCNNYSQSNPTSSVKCTWNNEVIFQSTTSSSNVDAIYELIKIMKDDLLNMGIMTQSEYIQMMSWYKNALYVSKLSPDSVYKTALSDNIQTKNNYYYQKINTLFIFAKTNGYITESMYSTINRKYYNVTIASSEDKGEYYYNEAQIEYGKYKDAYYSSITKVLTVYFSAAGTLSPSSIQVNSGSTISNFPLPVKEGYKFLGWYTTEINDGTQVTTSTKITQSMKLYARWEQVMTVIFGTYSLYMDNSLVKLSDISKDNAQTKCNETLKNNPNKPIVCIWNRALLYTNRGNTAGYQVMSSTATGVYIQYRDNENSIAIIFPNYNKEKSIDNCMKNALGNPSTSVMCTLDGEIVYSSKGTNTIYNTVYFSTAGSVSPSNIQVSSGATISTLPTPILSGYKFLGWYTTENIGGTQVTSNTKIKENMKIYARWEQINTEILGTYMGYMNGNVFIITKDISKDYAYANCKLNATNNPNASIKCTWNELLIYQTPIIPINTGSVSTGSTTIEKLGLYEGYMNDKLYILKRNVSKSEAYNSCVLTSKGNPTAYMECKWNGELIYRFIPDVTVSTSNKYYDIIKSKYYNKINSLSTTKLETVIYNVQKYKNTFSKGSDNYLILEALEKLVNEVLSTKKDTIDIDSLLDL